jgi:hypothetical protein
MSRLARAQGVIPERSPRRTPPSLATGSPTALATPPIRRRRIRATSRTLGIGSSARTAAASDPQRGLPFDAKSTYVASPFGVHETAVAEGCSPASLDLNAQSESTRDGDYDCEPE